MHFLFRPCRKPVVAELEQTPMSLPLNRLESKTLGCRSAVKPSTTDSYQGDLPRASLFRKPGPTLQASTYSTLQRNALVIIIRRSCAPCRSSKRSKPRGVSKLQAGKGW